MAAKWVEPCKLCKGKSPVKCRFCGWKAKIKKAYIWAPPELTPAEILERDAFREGIVDKENLLMGVWKYSMDSVHSSDKDGNYIEPEDRADREIRIGSGAEIDQSILRHLRWVEENIVNPYREGRTVDSIVKETKLTTKIVKVILHNALRREAFPVQLQKLYNRANLHDSRLDKPA